MLQAAAITAVVLIIINVERSHNGTGHYGILLVVIQFIWLRNQKVELLEFYRKNQVEFTITVKGNCMDPVIKNGDKVRIRPCKSYKVGDIVLCVDANHVRYIHRIYQIVNHTYITKADNNAYADAFHLTNDNIFGKAIL